MNARAWLESLPAWDGVSRLADVPRALLRTPREHQAHASAVVSRWLVDCVRRAYAPGCEVGPVLVLAGPKGCGKGFALRCLAGDWYARAQPTANLAPYEIAQALHAAARGLPLAGGALVVRVDVEENRAWGDVISDRTDWMRARYSTEAVSTPRGFVVVATTRDTRADFGRRFEVVVCDRVAHLSPATRDRLWSEALVRAEVRRG